MIKVLRVAFFLTVGMLLHTTQSKAMMVSPIYLDMNAAGNNNHAQISVTNDGAKALPVEIIVSHIDLNENGEALSKIAGEEFLIFPPQAMVSPGATQVFRIQWVGDPQIKTSQSYTFSVNQVPVRRNST
jgi:P pilus assembly chaperone PapD